MPANSCDPAGFPRSNLFELRAIQIVQTSNQMLILYEYQRVWRVIWTDGRELPKDPDPSLYGYSVGKWVDDNTFKEMFCVPTEMEEYKRLMANPAAGK